MITDQASLSEALKALNTSIASAVDLFESQIDPSFEGECGAIGIGYQYIGDMRIRVVMSSANIYDTNGDLIEGYEGETVWPL